jgi:hypothetical protein
MKRASFRQCGWQLPTGQAAKPEVGSQQIAVSAKKNFLQPRSFRFQVYNQ